MIPSRKDRRKIKRLETRVARRMLPIVKDNQVRAPIRTRYAISLANGEAPLAVLHRAYAEADAFATRVFAQSVAPACAAGCSHCCENARVGLTAREARTLVNHLRHLPTEQLATIRARIASNAATVRDAPLGTRPGTICALLDDDRRCTVYEHRPFSCRRAHSFDADLCRRATAGEDVGITVDARVFGMYAETSTAFCEADAAFGGDATSYDFHQALNILLDDPKGELSPARERSNEPAHRAAADAMNVALRKR